MKIYLSYAVRGANTWWRYLVCTPLALGLTVVLGTAIVVVLTVLHAVPRDLAARIQAPQDPVSFYPIIGMLFAVIVAGFALAIRIMHKKTPGDVIGAWTWRSFGSGFAIWAGIVLVTALIDFAIDPSGFRFTATRDTPMLALVAFGGLAAQTFAEEFVFRGYLTQGLLLATKRIVPTALISGALFGAMHIPNGGPQAVSATIFGVGLALIAIRTGGIAFTYGLHLANNLSAAVVLVSSGDAFRGSPGLLTQTTPQLMWWDTAVGSIAVILLAVAMVWRSAQKDRARA